MFASCQGGSGCALTSPYSGLNIWLEFVQSMRNCSSGVQPQHAPLITCINRMWFKKTTLYVLKEKTNASAPSFLLFSLLHPSFACCCSCMESWQPSQRLAAILALAVPEHSSQLTKAPTHRHTLLSQREKLSSNTLYAKRLAN